MRDPYEAFYGHVCASEIAAWFQDHGPRLLEQNLRKIIDRSDVNSAIEMTLRESPERFWYLNNGITVLCDSIKKKPLGGDDRRTGVFVCDGVSVVNGAQTVGAIAQVHRVQPHVVSQSQVFVRFISLQECPQGFAKEVTRATNRQNRIERQDFIALDPEQERIRTELMLDGKTYAVKRGETRGHWKTGCTLVEATVALACMNEDVSLAVLAKREIGKLWEDIDKPPYKQIFNGSVTGPKVWFGIEVARAVDLILHLERERTVGRARLVVVHGNRFILHHVFRRLVTEDPNAVRRDIEDLRADIRKLVAAIVGNLVHSFERVFLSAYPASVFKNVTKCKQLSHELASQKHASDRSTGWLIDVR